MSELGLHQTYQLDKKAPLTLKNILLSNQHDCSSGSAHTP